MFPNPPDLKFFYTLDDAGNPVRAASFTAWAEWFMHNLHHRHLCRDELRDGVYVSTVFLGLNQDLFGDGPPLLWETMIFGGPHNEYCDRYATREDAIAGHETALSLAKGSH